MNVALWLGHSRGLLTEIQEAMNENVRVYPYDVSQFGLSGVSSAPMGELIETEGVCLLRLHPLICMHERVSLSALKLAFFDIRMPFIYLAIKSPGYYLLPDGQRRLRYYISHYITPVRVNDETKWIIQPTLGDNGRPLTGISSTLLTKNALFDTNTASQEICNLMGTSNLKSLLITIEVPESTLQTTFSTPEEMKTWWNIFRGKVRMYKGRTQWFPPTAASGYGDLTDKFLCFASYEDEKNPRPFRWRLEVSLRHLLLFYLIKTKPEGSELTKLEKRNLTYTVLPKKVRSFFQDWNISHG